MSKRPYPSLIEPEFAESRTIAEKNALIVSRLLPGATMERTRDVIQFDLDGASGVVVLVTAEAVEFRLPTVEWTCGSYGPVETSRLWKRVKWSKLQVGQLADLIDAARRARQREFRSCKFCGKKFPPEHRDGDVCHGCQERFQGIVH